jgi:hypothetical protein
MRILPPLAALVMASLPIVIGGQRGESAQPTAARRVAPIDLTGYWVSIVTEDWRYRMVTPPKGDFPGLPLNAAARQIANAWDPAKDEADGNACKSYGVGNVMRVPGRVHITWQDDSTLKIETDAGMQARLLHFGDAARAPAGDAGWQGHSVARWEIAGPQRRGGGAGTGPAPDGRGRGAPATRFGSLKVVTTHMRAGYLRKNGVPYSENAVVTEFFDRHTEANGDEWFTVTTIVDDPKYLTEPLLTSSHFKREANGDKWRPSPCTAG